MRDSKLIKSFWRTSWRTFTTPAAPRSKPLACRYCAPSHCANAEPLTPAWLRTPAATPTRPLGMDSWAMAGCPTWARWRRFPPGVQTTEADSGAQLLPPRGFRSGSLRARSVRTGFSVAEVGGSSGRPGQAETGGWWSRGATPPGQRVDSRGSALACRGAVAWLHCAWEPSSAVWSVRQTRLPTGGHSADAGWRMVRYWRHGFGLAGSRRMGGFIRSDVTPTRRGGGRRDGGAMAARRGGREGGGDRRATGGWRV